MVVKWVNKGFYMRYGYENWLDVSAISITGSERLHGISHQERQLGVCVQAQRWRCGDSSELKARQPMARSLQLYQSWEVISFWQCLRLQKNCFDCLGYIIWHPIFLTHTVYILTLKSKYGSKTVIQWWGLPSTRMLSTILKVQRIFQWIAQWNNHGGVLHWLLVY